MAIPSLPRIRPLELVPLPEQDGMYALRDPQGFSGTVALPESAAKLVTLMNGERTLADLRRDFETENGKSLTLDFVRQVVEQLDDLYFLDSPRFAAYEAAETAAYRSIDVRPTAHAGSAYHKDATALRAQLGNFFTCDQGPGILPWEGNSNGDFSMPNGERLCGVMSPHIDFQRGGPTFAWAYDRIVTESDAELFIVLGTAHTALSGLFSVSQKHYETPLGQVECDRDFVESFYHRFKFRVGEETALQLFRDELPHRNEHSIEFQTIMLKFSMGEKRNFQIVPILVGSFHQFVMQQCFPDESEVVTSFVTTLRETIEAYGKKVCFIGGVDLAHIGTQFGDREIVDEQRLKAQWTDDQKLLSHACAGDSLSWFGHVATSSDRNRICGLAPVYTMLETMKPQRGELLRYDQAVAPDGTSCVSFASLAFYG